MRAAASDGGAVLKLPARVGSGQVGALAADLWALAGQSVRIDASGVLAFGALGLQVLLAAARDRRSTDLGFAVAPQSDAFSAALATFGVILAPAAASDAPR